jgi:hypothetical protein
MQVMVKFYAILIAEFMFRLQGPLQPSASFVVTKTRNMTFTKSLQASDPDHSEVLQCLALWVQQQMLSVVSFASIIMHQQLLTLWDSGTLEYWQDASSRYKTCWSCWQTTLHASLLQSCASRSLKNMMMNW